MGKSKLIAYIESPFQILGAFEFQRQHAVDIHWVIRKSNPINDRQIVSTLDFLGINRKHVTIMPKIEVKNVFTWALFLLRGIFHLVLLGDPGSKIGCLFLRKIIIDDGTYNINYIMQNPDKKYWTIFDVKSHNNYDFIYLRKQLSNYTLEKSERNFFIGQPLSELGLISERKYLSILNSYSLKHKIVYFPHRRESSEKLSKLDIPIHHSEAPLEIELINMRELPISIIGFYSTALYSLKLLYGMESYSIKVETDSLEVREIYDFFEQNGVSTCVV